MQLQLKFNINLNLNIANIYCSGYFQRINIVATNTDLCFNRHRTISNAVHSPLEIQLILILFVATSQEGSSHRNVSRRFQLEHLRLKKDDL